MPYPARYIDSHLHLDHVRESHPARIRWLQAVGCVPISWSFGQRIDTVTDLRAYLDRQQSSIAEIASGGCSCYYLAGVHPRNIPTDLVRAEVRELLLPRLDDPRCLGIGEIGLETGEPREVDIFEAQLELAPEVRERGKVLGIHTPRGEKVRRTRETLAVVAGHPAASDIAVVDHVTPATASDVLAARLRLGVTLSPAKSAVADVRRILGEHPAAIDRLQLNTDSGTEFHEDLWRAVETCAFGEGTNRLVCGNAATFYGIIPGARDAPVTPPRGP